MTAPVMLDVFCGVGGATWGYHQRGLRVVGVDINPQPNFCGDEFIRADALEVLADREFMSRFVAVHASCPCQERCAMTTGTNRSKGWGREHVQLVPETRRLLQATGLPWIIEQPTGHGGLIRTDLRLCMDMFPIGPPPWVQRHRDFELSGFTVPQPAHPRHEGRVRGLRHGVWADGPYVAAYGSGGGKASIQEMRHAMGIPWAMTRSELTEAIPPAYTAFIGEHLLKVVSAGPGLSGVSRRDGSRESGIVSSNVD